MHLSILLRARLCLSGCFLPTRGMQLNEEMREETERKWTKVGEASSKAVFLLARFPSIWPSAERQAAHPFATCVPRQCICPFCIAVCDIFACAVFGHQKILELMHHSLSVSGFVPIPFRALRSFSITSGLLSGLVWSGLVMQKGLLFWLSSPFALRVIN